MQRNPVMRRATSRAMIRTAIVASLAAGAVVAMQGRPVLADPAPPIALLSYCVGSSSVASGEANQGCGWVNGTDRQRAADRTFEPTTRVYLSLAQAFLDAGDAGSAIAQYRSALTGDPANPALYALLGKAQDRLGLHQDAQQSYMAGLDRAPNDEELFDLLDRSLMASEMALAMPIATQAPPEAMLASASCPVPFSHVPSHAWAGSWEVGDSREHATLCRSDLTVDDLLDVVNPLHHIPVIATLYRQASGDDIDGAARILGGALFGGPVGMFSSALEHFFEESTGSDFGETALVLFNDPFEQSDTEMAQLPEWRQRR